jgi:hypothetical protein
MTPQNKVTRVRKPKTKAGGRASMSRNLKGSAATGALPVSASSLRLKINPPRASGYNKQGIAPALSFSLYQDGEEQADKTVGEDKDWPVVQPEALTSRSGRVIKAPRYDDFAYGSDTFLASSISKADDDDCEGDYQGPQGSSRK